VLILSCSDPGRAYGVSSDDVGPDPWRSQGLCLDEDPELFFPDGESSPEALAQVAMAKAVCEACPVLAECREYELAPVELRGKARLRNPDAGVFAAMTAAERRAEVRRRARLAEVQARLQAEAAVEAPSERPSEQPVQSDAAGVAA